jgi:hypothetical protein
MGIDHHQLLLAGQGIAVHQEAAARGYSFDDAKISPAEKHGMIPVTEGQVLYEFSHLLNKLEKRNPALFVKLHTVKKPGVHPLFKMVPGPVEKWEKRESPAQTVGL